MFQLSEFTEAHVASVTNRQETHGDEKVPAVSIGLDLTCANTILDQIDQALRHSLYKAVESQEQLPGIEPATPVLRCNSIEKVTLPTSHEGWTLSVDDGIDDTVPMVFGAVKIDKFVVEPKQGGSISLRFRCGTSDIDADRLGKLGMHNGQSIWIKLTAPAKDTGPVIDGSNEAFEADHPDATDLFAAGDEQPDDNFARTESEVEHDDGQPDEAAEFEAGAAAAIAAAGVTPKGARRPRRSVAAVE